MFLFLWLMKPKQQTANSQAIKRDSYYPPSRCYKTFRFAQHESGNIKETIKVLFASCLKITCDNKLNNISIANSGKKMFICMHNG